MVAFSLHEALTSVSPSVLLLSTLPIVLLSALVRRAFFSHLAEVPGPIICRFTSLWIWYHSYLGHEASLITALHATYGPVVRIGPNECVISDGAALNAIYNERGGFRKADCYANFDFEGHATIFSARDGEYRAMRSKAVMPLFSTSNIRAGQKTIEGCVQRFIQRIRSEAKAKEQPVDILNLSRSLALDAVSSYLFGRPYGGIEEKTDRLSASVFVDMLVATGRFFFLPHWLFVVNQAAIAKLLPCKDVHVDAGGVRLDSFARGIVEDTPAGDSTFQGRLKKAGVSDHENEVQCMDLMFAGTDSTGTNLCKLIWRLAKTPEVYKRLRDEILEADAENLGSAHPYGLSSLKYLDAVVHEGLRMGMSTPTRIPRVVPQGGWSFKGYHFPAGTQVGCQPYTLHFNPAVFQDPFLFKPERWLDRPTAEMHRDWIAFSLGSRACLARNLAHTELLLAIRAVAREGVLEGATALGEDIQIYEWFNSALKEETLELVWQRNAFETQCCC